MRISDWSSDVCSSDLHRTLCVSKILALHLHTMSADSLFADLNFGKWLAFSERNDTSRLEIADFNKTVRNVVERKNLRIGRDEALNVLQIGRASCRERVCQYV